MSEYITAKAIGKIREEIEALKGEMANGLPDWETYKKILGKIQGLRIAEGHVLDADSEVRDEEIENIMGAMVHDDD